MRIPYMPYPIPDRRAELQIRTYYPYLSTALNVSAVT
jgi:hypothetical protein